jgi:hypothetical protein
MEQLDDAGNSTGKVILKFKSKAAYKPAIFDAKGIPMIDSNVWGGSEIKINGSIAPYYTPLIGAGVALRLRAVQVIQYVDASTGAASKFGFEEEVGYEHQATETFESIAASPVASVEDEPKVRAPSKPPVEPADDLSDIINQWAIK